MAILVLWLDNDPLYIKSYVKALEDRGDNVDIATSVTDAENGLKSHKYNLIIIDAMIPTMSEEEEIEYPPEETDRGLKLGVSFYKRVAEKTNTPVLAMTVRLDETIRNEFKNAGLPEAAFTTKLAVRKIASFLEKIDSLTQVEKTSDNH